MSRGGGVGGPATLSSVRVQKAFSINFRENKRLRTKLRLIEVGHTRAIRQAKQEITETKLWLKGVQESTGYSQYGLSNADKHHMCSPTVSRRMSLPASVASVERASPRPTTRGRTSQPDIMCEHTIEEGAEPQPQQQQQQQQQQQSVPPTHVRFAWSEQGPRRPSRDPMSTAIAQPPPPSTAGPETGNLPLSERRPYNRHQNCPEEDKSASQPEGNDEITEAKKLDMEQDVFYGGLEYVYCLGLAFADPGIQSRLNTLRPDEKKLRIHSGASAKSNQSLNACQRRHILQSMVVKTQSSLVSKKEIHTKECVRVNTKVSDYLNNLAERMKITLPDVSMFEFDPEKHNTPFAQNVNIT